MSTAQFSHSNPTKCTACDGNGYVKVTSEGQVNCEPCDGIGWFGIDPTLPHPVPQGWRRVKYMAARYDKGLPIWDPQPEEEARYERPEAYRVQCDVVIED